MKNKHMKLISVSKTRPKSLFSLLRVLGFFFLVKMKTIFSIRGLEVQNLLTTAIPKVT